MCWKERAVYLHSVGHGMGGSRNNMDSFAHKLLDIG